MNGSTRIGMIVIGLIWFIAGIFMLSTTFSWAETFSVQVEDSLFLGMFWVGYTALIIFTIFIPPFVLVINAFKGEE